MNRTAVAILVFVVAAGAILAGAYWAFFALAAQIAPGRTLGMISAALMVASGLACAGVGYLASKWAQKPD